MKMTEKQNAEQKAEHARWAEEARDALNPKKRTKGSHEHPSPSDSGTPHITQVKPLPDARPPGLKGLRDP